MLAQLDEIYILAMWLLLAIINLTKIDAGEDENYIATQFKLHRTSSSNQVDLKRKFCAAKHVNCEAYSKYTQFKYMQVRIQKRWKGSRGTACTHLQKDVSASAYNV